MPRKPVKGYEGLYEVDSQGNVFSLDRVIVGSDGVSYPRKGRLLSQTVNAQTGYPMVSLWKNNFGSSRTVHRLVAIAHIPNPENKPEVNHLDGDKLNSAKSNLEWATRSENSLHAYAIGLNMAPKLFEDEQYDLLLDAFLDGVTMTAIAEQEGCGLSRLTINLRQRAVLQGKEDEFDQQIAEQRRTRNTLTNVPKRKRVAQFSLDGTYLTEHESLTAAAKAIGRSSSGSISNSLNPNHPQQKAFGYLWKFV